MREMRWRPGDLEEAAPITIARLRWLLTAEHLVAAHTQVATVQYKEPEQVETKLDLALFGLPEMPDLS